MWRLTVFSFTAGIVWSSLVAQTNNLRTLRAFQAYACDGDDLSIECSPHTVISITKVEYGSPVQDFSQCRVANSEDANENSSAVMPTDCPVSHSIELLENLCKDKEKCHMKVVPELFSENYCLDVRKFVEISYKCRPRTFHNKIVCEGGTLKLRCRKMLRIVIYNAWYGSTSSAVPECPQQRKHGSENCEADYATETVMHTCHGRLKCALQASRATFGNLKCPKKANLYLKVVYTCVSKNILQDVELENHSETLDYLNFLDETLYPVATHNLEDKGNDLGDLLEFTIAATQSTGVLSDASGMSPDTNCTTDKDQRIIGFLTEWVTTYKFITDNKEKFILYLTVSLGAGLLAFLIILSIRLYIQQQRQLKKAKLNISDPLPLSVDDDCSDMDQYDSRHDHSVEVVRYTNTSTVRRQDSNCGPRAPLSHSMNNYYYN